MNRILLLAAGLSLLLAAGCATSDHDRAINDPAGAQWATNAAPDTPARDIYQRPYPGVEPSSGVRIGPGSTQP